MPLSDEEELELLRLRKHRAQVIEATKKLKNPRELDYQRMEYAPTKGMSGVKKFAAGMGKAVADPLLGIRQITGLASQEEVDERKQLDAPLMASGAGQAGNLVGNAALTTLPGAALSGVGGAMSAVPALARTGEAVSAVGKLGLTAPANLPGAITTGAMGALQGGVQPVAGDESRVQNMMLGGGAGALIPTAGMIAKGGKALFEPIYAGGREKIVGRVLNDAAGDAAPSAIANLRNAGVLVPGSQPTAAEVANSGGIAAVQRTASAVDPESYAARAQAQNQARVGALQDIVGPPGRLENAVKTREQQTGALRDAALDNANLGTRKTAELEGRLAQKNDAVVSALQEKGRAQAMAAEQANLAAGGRGTPTQDSIKAAIEGRLMNRQTPQQGPLIQGNPSPSAYPVEGMPRIPGRYTENAGRVPEGLSAGKEAGVIEAQRKSEREFLEYQLNSLKQHGYSPLRADTLISQLDSVTSAPGNRASDVVTKTVGEIKEKLASLADKSGNLNAKDLYTVRKEIGNTISKYAQESQNWDKRFTAGITRDIQRGIDDTITKAGAGDLWGQYLTKYGEMSKPVNQIELVQGILDKSVRPLDGVLMPNQYARSLSDEMAQSVTGFGGATLGNTLDPKSLGVLTNVRKDLARSEQAKNLGRGPGSDTVQKMATANLMNRSGMPAWAMDFPGVGRTGSLIYKEADEKMKAELAETLLDPHKAALLMQNATPTQREKLISGILRIGGGPLTLGAALTYSGSQK